MPTRIGGRVTTHSSSKGWSPVRQLWDELNGLDPQPQWRKVIFHKDQEHRVPAYTTGIYMICGSPPGTRVEAIHAYTVFYVGKVGKRTHGLRERFREHLQRLQDPLFGNFVKCFHPVDFWYAVVDIPGRISGFESVLKLAFNPPCNKIDPPGTSKLRIRLGEEKRIRRSQRGTRLS